MVIHAVTDAAQNRVGLTTWSVIEALGEPAALLDGAGTVVAVNAALTELTGSGTSELVGRRPPEAWWTVSDWSDPALLTHDDLPAALMRADGRSQPVLCRVTPIDGTDGSVLRLVRFTRAADLHQQGALTRLAVEQAALARVAQEVARAVEASQVFELVAREVAAVLGVEAGLVMRFGDGESRVVGSYGDHRSQVGVTFPLEGGGATAQVARTGRPARAEYSALDSSDPTAQRVGTQGYRRGVAAPVTVGRRLWGVVLAATTGETPLPTDAEVRLGRFADMVSLAIAQAELLAELARRATTDDLTGLLNQGEFHRRLGQESARAQRYRRRLALVLIDIDHFKSINDSRGHLVGDRTLRVVAGALAPAVRPQDVLGRVGGEEFALVLPEQGLSEAEVVAERLRRLIEGLEVEDVPRVTISAGVADLLADGGSDALYAAADRALYAAKHAGRNRVCSAPFPPQR